MNPDGTGQRRLTVVLGEALVPRWSPDGKRLVYGYTPPADGDQDIPSQIHVMAADGSGDHVFSTEHSAIDPAWSPDGRRIAFSQLIDDQYDLFLMNADGSSIERLTDDTASDWDVVWTPDGTGLVFNSDRAGTFHIHRLDLASGAIAQLTSGASNDYNPGISPDGGRLAFTSDRRGESLYDVWLAGVDGSDPVRLTVGDDVGDSYMPTWSPDGSTIAFVSNRTGDFELYSMPAAGGEATNLSQNPGADDGWARAQWSPDGSTIVYPSTGNIPSTLTSDVRQSLGAAAILIGAALLAGTIVYQRRRYGTLPLGSYAVVIAAPLALATVMHDEYLLLPAIVGGAFLAELIVRAWPAGQSRLSDGLGAFFIPAGVFALYFLTIAVTDGLGWKIHMWLGAIFTAGIIGLFLDELTRARTADAARLAA
jgi:TolB protein